METPEWIYPGAMCRMRNGGKFEVWKEIDGYIVGYNHKIGFPGRRSIDRKGGVEADDIIGPWVEPLELKLPPPSFFKDRINFIACDKDGTWSVFEKIPYIKYSEWLRSDDLDGVWGTTRHINIPEFPYERWKETLHQADRENDVWVPVKEEEN